MNNDHIETRIIDGAASASPAPMIRDLSVTEIRIGDIEIRVKGKPVSVPSVQIDGRRVITTGTWLKIAAVQDEDLVEGEVVADPQSFIPHLKETGLKADIFTFAQK